MRAARLLKWALPSLVAVLLFLLHLGATRDNTLFDDAADYMQAAKAPATATWLNTNSASPIGLIRMRAAGGAFAEHPWESLYAARDNAALRHFHSPVSFYAMHAVQAFGGQAHAQRLLTSFVASAACGVLLALLIAFDMPWPVALALAMYAGLQSRLVQVFADPSPHAWYMLFALSFLFFLARLLSTWRERDLYAATVSLALAFSTLEFTVLLLAAIPAALGLCWLMQHRNLPPADTMGRSLQRAAMLFFGVTFVVWPGGWLRGGYVANYGLLTLQMFFRHNTAFAKGELLSFELVYDRLASYDAILLLLVVFWAAALIALFLFGRLSVASIVLSAYALLAFLLGLANHFRLGTYISEFLVFVIPAAGLLGLDVVRTWGPRVPAKWRKAGMTCAVAAAMAVLVMGCGLEWQQRWEAWSFRPYLPQLIAGVRSGVPRGAAVLVSQDRNALALYIPDDTFLTVGAGDGAATSRFTLLDTFTPADPGAIAVARFPAAAGHTLTLWKNR